MTDLKSQSQNDGSGGGNSKNHGEDQDQKGFFHQLTTAESNFRQQMHHHMIESKFGQIIDQVIALTAGISTIIYIVLTYDNDCPLILERWFHEMEKFIAIMMLALYIVIIYVKPNRYVYLKQYESMLILTIVSPILLIDEISMKHNMFVFVCMSRHIRIPYFIIILIKYHEN